MEASSDMSTPMEAAKWLKLVFLGFTRTKIYWAEGSSGGYSDFQQMRTFMSIISISRGWRCDFQFNKRRYQSSYYRTKTEAKAAKAEKRKELKNPVPIPKTPTDMAFLTFVNNWLDYLQAYRAESHYREAT